jgi:formylglycine-generating enzyme required for sulfatase activity
VGALDLSGNVFEWAGDWYEEAPLAGVDAQGPASGSVRVTRGGSWNFVSQYARVARPSIITPGRRADYLGVRLLRTAP